MASNVTKTGKSALKIRIVNGIYKDDLKVAETIPFRYVIKYPLESITGILPRQTKQIVTGVGSVKFPKAAQQRVYISNNEKRVLCCLVIVLGWTNTFLSFCEEFGLETDAANHYKFEKLLSQGNITIAPKPPAEESKKKKKGGRKKKSKKDNENKEEKEQKQDPSTEDDSESETEEESEDFDDSDRHWARVEKALAWKLKKASDAKSESLLITKLFLFLCHYV